MVEILFTADLDEFIDSEESRPQPAKNFIPEWYKNIPIDMPDNHNVFQSKIVPNLKTTKRCPSFANIFHEDTYVVVSPCDVHIYNFQDKWFAKASHPNVDVHHHDDNQFVNHVPGKPIKAVFRIVTRYHCLLPKGYALRYIPMSLHFNQDYYATYGVIDQDKMTQLNIQLMITTDKEEFLIKKGEPLCYIIPYKKEKFNYTFKYMDQKLKRFIRKIGFITISKFKGGYIQSESHDYTKE